MPLGVKTHFSGQVIYFQKEKGKKRKKKTQKQGIRENHCINLSYKLFVP